MPPTFSDHREHLQALRRAALQAVDPGAAVRRALTPDDVADARRVFIVGAGKAGVAMAQAAAEIVGERLRGGVMVVPKLVTQHLASVIFIQGGHPTPTEGSLAGGRAIAELLEHLAEHDLVIALFSGGGSALMEWLKPGLSLADLQATTTALLKCGATINELNAVRKRLSRLKGGGLLRLAAPARVLGLILSDVVGNPLEVIASGPTVPADPDLAEQAWRVVEKYQLHKQLPLIVLETLLASNERPQPESAARVENRLIASNQMAGEAAARAARDLGFHAEYLADNWQGEAREVGKRFVDTLRARAASQPRPYCLIVGGETTVTVRGAGKGGRNQELALAAALAVAGQPQTVISTFATDGMDGPTEAAGATVTGETLARARARGLDAQTYLDNNDAYSFFSALGDLVITGLTGTNVNDLSFGLVY